MAQKLGQWNIHPSIHLLFLPLAIYCGRDRASPRSLGQKRVTAFHPWDGVRRDPLVHSDWRIRLCGGAFGSHNEVVQVEYNAMNSMPFALKGPMALKIKVIAWLLP